MNFIDLPSSKVPVKYKTQLTVMGGGPAGISAAISAARNGTEVLLIERNGFLGGQATGGLVIILCGLNDSKERIIRGFCQEIINYLELFNASKLWHNYIIFEPEVLKRCFDEYIIKNKVNLLLNSLIVDAIVEHDYIKYIIIETKSGRLAIETDFIIDCTGDADSLKWTNETFDQQPKDKARSVTACFRVGGVDVPVASDYVKMHKEEYEKIFQDNELNINPWHWASTVNDNFVWFDMSHINNIDITDVDDLTQAELKTRELSWKIFETYKKYVKGFENSYMVDIAPLLGVRDSRRLQGEYFITESDYGKHFEDCISFAPYYYDKQGVGKLQIPYRSLLPRRIKNLLVAGRAIGIEHKLIDCIREIPCCMATGQASGVAVSIAINKSVDLKFVDYSMLQNALRSQGAYI